MRKLLKAKGACTFITLICIITIIVSLLSIKSIKYNNYAGIYNNENTNQNGYIDVNLISKNDVSVSLNDSVNVKYEVKPKIINTKLDDIIFVIDLSKYMRDNNTSDGSRGRIICVEKVLQNLKKVLKNLKKDNNINGTNCFFVGYNSEWTNESLENYNNRFKTYSESAADGKLNKFFNLTNLLEEEELELSKIKDIPSEGFNFYNNSSNTNDYYIKLEKNLGDALSTANNYLSKIESKERNKGMIMFSRRACLYSTDIDANINDNKSLDYDNLLNDIKKKNYQIITVNLSVDEKISTYNENNDELLKLHKKLSLLTPQKDYNYIVADPEKSGQEYQYGSYGDRLWNNIFPKIILGTSDSSANCSVKNIKLVFGKCGNFEVSNLLINDKNDENCTFSEENGQLVINIPEEYIKYSKDNSNQFIADSFEVSFSIKVKKGGNNIYFGTQNNGDVKAELSYSSEVAGKNDEITTVIDTTRVTTNKLMDIKLNPKLVEPDPHEFEAEIGKEFDVKYKVDVTSLDNLESTISKSRIDEVLFLIDFYKNDNLQGNYFRNGLNNKIIHASNLNHMKKGIYGMTKDGAVEVRGNDERNQYNNIKLDLSEVNLLDNSSILESRAKKIDDLYNKQSENSNVMKALKTADDVLQTEGEKNKNKAIVLMITGRFQVDKDELSQLINRGYKIIITDLSYTDKTTSQANESIKELIDCVGKNNFVDGQFDDGGSSFVNKSCDSVAEKINKLLVSAFDDRMYDLKNINFTFDLGEGFAIESKDAEISYIDASGKTKICRSNFEENDKIRKVNIPDITFTSEILDGTTSQNEVKVKYTPYINNDEVKEGNIDLKFRPKFIKYTHDNPVVFGTKEKEQVNNYFSYDDIDGIERTIKPIDTPRVKKNNIDITHGVYLTDENKKPIIKSPCLEIFSKGSVVTMAAQFNVISKSDCLLTLDQGLTLVGQIKVYKIEGDTLIDLNINSDNNSFTIPSDTIGNIIVIYSVKIPPETSKKQFINCISVNKGEGKNATINSGTELPDLF